MDALGISLCEECSLKKIGLNNIKRRPPRSITHLFTTQCQKRISTF